MKPVAVSIDVPQAPSGFTSTSTCSPDWIEMEVIEAEPPRLPDGGTRINFRFEWIEAPLGDRLLAPVVRTILRRGDERAMRRLAAELERG
jgi:hypothetical protein